MQSFLNNLRDDLRTYDGDWTRQGFWVMVVYRFGRWRYGLRIPFFRRAASLLYKLSYKGVQVLTGIELPCEATIGKGFRIDHFGGIVISGYARFGDHCILRNGVTVGLKNVEEPLAPVLGHHVNIGAGAKILGPIQVGDHVDIGANAVVLHDVPSHSIAVGIPARIIPRKHQCSA